MKKSILYSKILVPYDFSIFGEKALKEALKIAKKFDSNVILLNVIGENLNTSGMDWTRAQEVHDETEIKVREELTKIKNSNLNENVDLSLEIVHNPSVVEGILSYSENNSIDLIVMGSHGRSGFKKLVLGSAASGIVTKAKCRVMIVK